MTGSGKTHTMGGIESDPGVIPRSIDQIFDSIDDDKDRAFFLRVTYLEVRLLRNSPPRLAMLPV